VFKICKLKNLLEVVRNQRNIFEPEKMAYMKFIRHNKKILADSFEK